MGSKITKILTASLLVGVLGLSAGAYQIPEKTMQIARERMIQAVEKKAPESEVIRVGIGNQAFNSYNYKDISVYGTDSVGIYDGNKFITTVGANSLINVQLTSRGMFEIYSGTRLLEEVAGPVHFVCDNGLLGVSGLKRAGKPALYHGAFEIVKSATAGFFNLVNMVEVEEYLKGVVPNEMPIRFGLEALKAQSVTARNYVLSPRVKASPNYDVVDSVASQVYYGANTEKDIATRAVQETEGIVALYGWDLILAQYSSTAGGYTEDFAYVFSDPKTKAFPSVVKPYLIGKPDIPDQPSLENEEDALKFYSTTPDSFDLKSPYYRWTREWTADELKANLEMTLPAQSLTGFVTPEFIKGEKLGEIENIVVKQRGKSGKIIELVIYTNKKHIHLFKELVIRRAFTKDGKALPSANVVFVPKFDDNGKLVSIKGFGGGYGHGVGMSQFGAGFMAQELGKSYEDILFRYYTGIVLATKPVTLSKDNNFVAQSFYSNKDKVFLVVDNKDKVANIILNINGKDRIFPLQSHIIGDSTNRIDITRHVKEGKNKVIFEFSDDESRVKGKELRLYIEVANSNGRNN